MLDLVKILSKQLVPKLSYYFDCISIHLNYVVKKYNAGSLQEMMRRNQFFRLPWWLKKKKNEKY